MERKFGRSTVICVFLLWIFPMARHGVDVCVLVIWNCREWTGPEIFIFSSSCYVAGCRWVCFYSAGNYFILSFTEFTGWISYQLLCFPILHRSMENFLVKLSTNCSMLKCYAGLGRISMETMANASEYGKITLTCGHHWFPRSKLMTHGKSLLLCSFVSVAKVPLREGVLVLLSQRKSPNKWKKEGVKFWCCIYHYESLENRSSLPSEPSDQVHVIQNCSWHIAPAPAFENSPKMKWWFRWFNFDMSIWIMTSPKRYCKKKIQTQLFSCEL